MSAHRPRLGRRTSWIGTAVSVLALLLAASACDSTSDASEGPVDNAGLEAAKATVAKAAVRPTEIPVTAPIDKPIPTGKKITFVSCGVEACALQGPILAEGAATLGWTVDQVATDGSPEKVQGAIDAAIRNGSDAVILNAADKDAYAKQISEAEAAGVPVRDVLLARHRRRRPPLQHRDRQAERPHRRLPRRRGRQQQRRQGRRALREHLGVPDPRAGRRDVRGGHEEVLPVVQRRQPRHPADVARQGRSRPDHLLPPQPPGRELHRALGRPTRWARVCRRRSRPRGSPTRSRSSAKAAVRRTSPTCRRVTSTHWSRSITTRTTT